MKYFAVIGLIVIGCISFITITGIEEPVAIPPSQQRIGNADSGYLYIVTGDYVKSGLPLNLYNMVFKKEQEDLLHRGGESGKARYDFNVVKAYNDESIAVPNCFQCHADFFNGKLIPGLGSSTGDFTADQKLNSKVLEKVLMTYLKLSPKKYDAARDFVRVGKTIGDDFFTESVGVNPADMLTALLIVHRDPVTLQWNEKAAVDLPKQVVPSDVPAWWLLKKKNAMFYNGFGRGDFGKFLMGSILLTVKDTAHAREVDRHMPDVLAYLYSIQPPKYPGSVDDKLAQEGKIIFENNCSSCHGTYGKNESYPNLLIPESIIGTDSMLNKSNYQYSYMMDWYNSSWFSKNDGHPAKLVPFNGYIAPPLDGVWITAPYFHNASVPTIEAVLDSKQRPIYWTRNFEATEYDYDNLGWKFQTFSAPGNKYVYNTTLPGYGNYGHNFGDHLTADERKAVIEYLKTL
jgi:hypothetical protein